MRPSERKRLAWVGLGAALIAAVPVFAACNTLIGLDGFDKVACTSDCGDAALDVTVEAAADASSDASDAGSADAPADVVVIPIPDGAAPASWARWPMPNPPDAGGGVTFSYQLIPDASVTDLRTNLVFNLKLGAASTFDDARKYCDGLEADGGVHWRLPTRIELVTLIDYTRNDPAVDTDHVPITSGRYWTSSVLRPPTNPYKFWWVDFTTGAVGASTEANLTILCVKGS